MRKQLSQSFEDIASVENLLEVWKEFVRGKRSKRDVSEFSLHLMDNIYALHEELMSLTYRHGGYHAFNISDPKPRNIHKASVRDRLVHHALHRVLYPFFEKSFIADSFSCQKKKGTHRALNRLRSFAYQVSKNNTRTLWVLKCDIKKFFANIDHIVLVNILRKYIHDECVLWLFSEIIKSFSSMRRGVGLPLGNLTSQLLVNIYMNEFDLFIKHEIKAKYYIRYADDFVILSENKLLLEALIPRIEMFLQEKLKLELHFAKVSIKTFASGVDFLGWVHFLDHRVLRTNTKRRMLSRINVLKKEATFNSYIGLLKHGNTYTLQKELLEYFIPYHAGKYF